MGNHQIYGTGHVDQIYEKYEYYYRKNKDNQNLEDAIVGFLAKKDFMMIIVRGNCS